MGMIFTPMTVIAFATLNPQYRTEASGIMNLTRSIGSSIGISLMVTVLAQTTVRTHDHLREFVTPYREPFATMSPALQMGEAEPLVAMINGEVLRQASLVGYVHCFKILAILTLLTIPFLFLLRRPPPLPSMVPPPPKPAPAASTQSGAVSGVKAESPVEGEISPA